MTKDYFIGIDVGTGSARCGIFDINGKMIANTTNDIKIWKPEADFVQQSSEDIWNACCWCVKEALKKASVKPEEIKGIGFDATCSLVVEDKEGKPVSISPDNSKEQNIIVWMDHRAIKQAEFINSHKFEVLDYIGGKISPEMEIPKILWLKNNMPERWNKMVNFYDLPDWLVKKATGSDLRSVCSMVCKWTYLAHKKSPQSIDHGPQSFNGIEGWSDEFFNTIGLNEIVEEGYSRIGRKIVDVGIPIVNGLTKEAAKELGLREGCIVSSSIIDAHAGAVGMHGIQITSPTTPLQIERGMPPEIDFKKRISLIGGTSSCHMALSEAPIFVDGVWGPYYSAVVPGLWLTEGGQSATGSLIDHVIFSNSASVELKAIARCQNKTVYEILNQILESMAKKSGIEISMLTKHRHVLPYFHGNRSPRANPELKGIIAGLNLEQTKRDLALTYLATIQSVAYGTRHIIESLNQKGYAIDTIIACGGGTKNPVFLKEHADITGCRIILPKEQESVLLGSAMLGATASGVYVNLTEAMAAMSSYYKIIEPSKGKLSDYHNLKYEVFHKMYECWNEYEEIMNNMS